MSSVFCILIIIPNSPDRRMMTSMDRLVFKIDELDDKNITLDKWINTNINPQFKLFFKNVILQVYHTFKDYYILQDFTNQPLAESVFRIGTDDSEKYKTVASKYKYKYGMGGSKARKTKRSIKRKKTKKNKRKLR